jgi:hypothetical protein
MTQMMPKLNAMLICDYVITEHGTNKKSLIGVFENINSMKFPCIHLSLSIYIKLTEARGTYAIRLELVDLKSDQTLAKAQTPRDITIQNPLMAHELVFGLKGLTFPHPGEYEFRVFANDMIFGQKSLRVVDRRSANK